MKASECDEIFIQASNAWDNNELSKAFDLFNEAAELGDSSSQLNLGYFYDMGIHVKKDRNKALYWYKKAYQQVEGSAASNIATIYRDTKEFSKALWWFHRATRMLDHDAYYEIGRLYEKGHGVKRNLKKAQHFYHKALTAKHVTELTKEQAQERINKIKP